MSGNAKESEEDQPEKLEPTVVTEVAPAPTKAESEFINWFDKVIVEIFFREISMRGSFNIPMSGPTLICIAPHANQFLDAAVEMYTVHSVTGRQTRFIEAAKSMRRKVIGPLSKMAGSIPVERAQDLLKPKKGIVKYKDYPQDELTIIGKGTEFTKDCAEKGLLGLPRNAGNAKVKTIVSDTELILAAPMKKDKQIKMLRDGTPYLASPRVDNHEMFNSVFDALHDGALIAIAAEGGSHDRTELLPLKPGIAIMALGAVAKYPGMKVSIVPCGLNYFHPEKFRSRAVLDFGKPIVVDDAMAAKYTQDSRGTVSDLMTEITSAMKLVTIQSPDYETLQMIQAARRLYSYGSRDQPPLPQVVQMTRNLLKGYDQYKDEPEVQHLKESVLAYNKKLKMYGLRDSQVEQASKDIPHNFVLLVERLVKLIFYSLLALPGTILFSPVFIACKVISQKKQKEALASSTVKVRATDVLGSWKVMIALVVAPILYFCYSLIGTYLVKKYNLVNPLTGNEKVDDLLIFFSCWAILVCTTYAALREGETGMDTFKSIKPLVMSLSPESHELNDLKEERTELSKEVTQVINDLGPKVFPKFYEQRIGEYSPEEYMNIPDQPRRRSSVIYPDEDEDEGGEDEKVVFDEDDDSVLNIPTAGRSRSNTAESDYSGFSEFSKDSKSNIGKLPDLSRVSIIPDESDAGSVTSVSSYYDEADTSGQAYVTGAKTHQTDLSARVRDAVLERNQIEDENA